MSKVEVQNLTNAFESSAKKSELRWRVNVCASKLKRKKSKRRADEREGTYEMRVGRKMQFDGKKRERSEGMLCFSETWRSK